MLFRLANMSVLRILWAAQTYRRRFERNLCRRNVMCHRQGLASLALFKQLLAPSGACCVSYKLVLVYLLETILNGSRCRYLDGRSRVAGKGPSFFSCSKKNATKPLTRESKSYPGKL